jgi:small subunit ribosomal protein S16
LNRLRQKNLPIRACKPPLRGLLSALFLGKAVRLTAAIGLSRPTSYKDFIMAVKIRMKRVGAKNAPVFRIVVADGRSPRDGKFIEELGTYQPRKKGDNYTLNLDRAKYWLSKGAQPSDTVASFIKKSSKAAAAAAA